MEKWEQEERLKPLFRKVLVFSLILSLTFPFSFNYLLESSKPAAPKEKFDAEVLFAVGEFILMVGFYMFAPWVFALILAYSYGYSWRILRSVEGRKHIGLIHIVFFTTIFVGMMAVVTFRNLHIYQVEERILELLVAEVALFAVSFLFVTFLLRKNGYGWKDFPELVSHSTTLDRDDFAKDKKARLAHNAVIGIVAYLFFAFMLADSVLRGKTLEFFIFIAKIFAVLGIFFLPLWLAVELYTRRRR